MIETLKILPDEWPLKLIYLNLFNNLNRFYNQKFQSSFGCLLAKSMIEQQQNIRKTTEIKSAIRIDRNRFVVFDDKNQSLNDKLFLFFPNPVLFSWNIHISYLHPDPL